MAKEKVVRILISILKKILKWSLILLAGICAILILLVVYLLVLEFFYDGESMNALIAKNDLIMSFYS